MEEEEQRVQVLLEKIVENLVERDYAVTDDFLSIAEVQTLTKELWRQHGSAHFESAGIGQGQQFHQDKSIRGDAIRWIDRTTLSANSYFFLERVEALFAYLNRTCYLGIRQSELHFAMYPAGTGYKRHLDVFQKTNARKISIVCYLSTNWEAAHGGQLRLYSLDKNDVETAIDIMPQAGRMICFKSDILEHEVLQATRERLSITGWLKTGDGVIPPYGTS